jgi:RNA polymerase sigma factor, sigma-70 family
MGEVVQLSERMSFETVYENYYDRVYTYVYSILQNKEDSEDVVSDTFITAYSSYDKYDSEKASVITWITRIAHNKAVNHVRSYSYRNRNELSDNDEMEGPGSDFTESVENNLIIEKLYEQLSEEEREFLNMRYTLGLRDSEVAEVLGINPKAVNKRYQRLLAKCRELL